jgi:hypothetical protein
MKMKDCLTKKVPDPDSKKFFPPDPGGKKAPDPDPQHGLRGLH